MKTGNTFLSFSPKNIKDQSIALALEVSSNFIKRIAEGACRIHGGGFAGTILAFLSKSQIDDYKKLMESVFGCKVANEYGSADDPCQYGSGSRRHQRYLSAGHDNGGVFMAVY